MAAGRNENPTRKPRPHMATNAVKGKADHRQTPKSDVFRKTKARIFPIPEQAANESATNRRLQRIQHLFTATYRRTLAGLLRNAESNHEVPALRQSVCWQSGESGNFRLSIAFLPARLTRNKTSPPPAEWISRRNGYNFVLLHVIVMAPVFWQVFGPDICWQGRTVACPLPGHHPWKLTLAGQFLSAETVVACTPNTRICRKFPWFAALLQGKRRDGTNLPTPR